MITREITFSDPFTGSEKTENFYFHLNKAEMIRIVGRSKDTEWEKYINEIVATGDVDIQMDFLEDFVGSAVGQKTVEGKFLKNKKIRDEFISSEAWGELFVKLIDPDNPSFADKFIKGIIDGARGNKEQANNLKSAASGNRANRRNKNK